MTFDLNEKTILSRAKGVFAATAVLAILATGAMIQPATAQSDWPTGPVEIVVGFNPGGGTDMIGRAIAAALEDELGVPVQVVNRAGGGGVVGFDALRTADADGYTAGIITAQVVTANLRGVMEATYEDFDLVAMLNIDQAGIAVPSDSPYQTLQDLLDVAIAAPGEVTLGNGSEGGSYHMMARNLEDASGAEFRHVPFDGGPAAILQLIGGHIDAAAVGTVEILPQVEAGEVRVLAVAGQDGDPRSTGMPDTPTTAEEGFPVQISTWRAIGMPVGVDPAIVEAFGEAVAAAVENPIFVDQMTNANAPIRYFGAEELLTYVQGQVEAYQNILD